VRGVGENPEDMHAKDEFGFVAPPMDDSAHAWHHADFDLVKTILDGSPRNRRMAPWRESLSRDDAEDLVAYIKSLWNFRSLACQGARHMRCM
jgi:mono/diheme cytochrome c family protein